jgi:hypothetical protein
MGQILYYFNRLLKGEIFCAGAARTRVIPEIKKPRAIGGAFLFERFSLFAAA